MSTPGHSRSPDRLALGVALLLLVGTAGATWWLLAPPGGEAGGGVRADLSLQETLGGADTAGYARADRPRDFVFPRDHGPHPDFRSEWWYITGNLDGDDGGRFGYQVTFFRSALAPAPAVEALPASANGGAAPTSGSSDWRSRQAWMVHFTVTDAEAGEFHDFERFERGALGLAGGRVEPDFRVWAGPWELSGGADAFPMGVRLDADGVAVDLELVPVRGPVLQGDGGLSAKGPEPGNASYYYSYPRLATTGTVTTPSGTREVRGESWLDREWSTSALSEGVVGWDWFALQLDDGRDVMVYGLRRADGTASPYSEGVVVEEDPDGEVRVTELGLDDFSVEVLDRWSSPVDGARYPARWRLRIPGQGLDLEVVPVLSDQELEVTFRYWEGAVDVRTHPAAQGSDAGVRGRGYVELTGYAGADLPGG